MTAQMRGFSGLPALRQMGLMIGLAASVALGVAVVLWSQAPNYRVLYSGLAAQDATQIADALQKDGIAYKVDENSGAVMVSADQVHTARLKMASQGLPKGTVEGFALLNEQPTFGTSQFMENARYQHALEGELGRTISELGNVQGARVHLAIPKQSVFIRNREPPSASVLINLYPGRSLEEGQVASIVHLLASSVPNLNADHVTVIDQKGRLLTSPETSQSMQLTASQFDYRRRLEENYIKRIEDIISPIAGVGGVRAQVVADLDFSVTEQTQETYNPDQPAIRSEQTLDEQSAGATAVAGVPGALTNQPPSGGTVSTPSPAAPNAKGALPAANTTGTAQMPLNSTKRATRNFELDKVISHTQMPSGSVRKLSVAVVVDDHQKANKKGEVVRTALKPEEIARITSLVKEAVGFSTQRGDTLNVINAPFTVAAETPMPEPKLLEQPWIWDVAKQALGGLAVLFLIFGVLRPVLRSLAEKGKESSLVATQHATAHMDELPGLMEDRISLPGMNSTAQGTAQLAAPSQNYESQLDAARTLVGQDPKRVAQVVKGWVASDA
ncbi:MAG: flagellar M-ring protein FliF [Gammaproteobacteria bacterium]